MAAESDEMLEIRQRVRRRVADNLHNILYDGTTPPEEVLKKMEGTQKPESAYSIQNVCWLIASMAIFYYTDFYIAVRYDPRVNRLWFNIGALLVCVNMCIAFFLIFWLSVYKKIKTDDWERLYPAAIPLATASFAVGSVCITVGLWPLWSIFTPVILFALFMGIVVTIAMLPNF